MAFIPAENLPYVSFGDSDEVDGIGYLPLALLLDSNFLLLQE